MSLFRHNCGRTRAFFATEAPLVMIRSSQAIATRDQTRAIMLSAMDTDVYSTLQQDRGRGRPSQQVNFFTRSLGPQSRRKIFSPVMIVTILAVHPRHRVPACGVRLAAARPTGTPETSYPLQLQLAEPESWVRPLTGSDRRATNAMRGSPASEHRAPTPKPKGGFSMQAMTFREDPFPLKQGLASPRLELHPLLSAVILSAVR